VVKTATATKRSNRKGGLPDLPETILLRRRVPVKEGAALLDMHEDTLRKNHPEVIEKYGPRLERVEIGRILELGRAKTTTK